VHYSDSLGQSLEVNQLCNLTEWQNLTLWVLEQTIEKRSQPLETEINLL
jgi:hypothetical protein